MIDAPIIVGLAGFGAFTLAAQTDLIVRDACLILPETGVVVVETALGQSEFAYGDYRES